MKLSPWFSFVFVMTLSWQGYASEFFVNPLNGSDAADGSEAHPFQTIARAMKELDGVGGKVNLDPNGGFYSETLQIKKGGAIGNPLIVDGHGSVINLGEDVTAGPWTDTGNGFLLGRKVTINPRWWLATPVFVNGLPLFTDDPKGSKSGQAWHGGSIRYNAEGRLIVVFPKGLSPANSVVVLTGGCCRDYMAAGVQFSGGSYVQIKNLTAAFAPNDGFGLHGNTHDIVFDNVKGLFNGDQGTSSHVDNAHTYAYNIDVRNSEFAFNGSGDAAVEDHLGTITSYTNVRVHQNRNLAFLFPENGDSTQGRHVLAGVVSFENGVSNLPKASAHIELTACQDLGGIGAGREIPAVTDLNTRRDPTKEIAETDRLGRFLQLRP